MTIRRHKSFHYFKKVIEVDYAGGMENFRQGSQEQYFLNCWRIGTDEDPRFWQKFTPEGDGVAIETTVGQLKHVLTTNLEMHMGLVRYVDQYLHFIPSTPPASYFYKQETLNELAV